MKRCFAALCGAGLLALLTSCAAPPQADTHDADVKAIKDTEVQWNKDFEAKDVDKLVAHYTDDAVLMGPGSPSASGKDAIRDVLKGMVYAQEECKISPAFTLKFEASRIDTSKSGEFGFTQGAYSTTMTDPGSKKVMNDKGSYVTVYKKQADGSWKAVDDIATSEVLGAPPPAKK